jgi:hypothetical protein
MKRIVLFLAALSLAAFACSVQLTDTPTPAPTEPPVPTEAPTDTPVVTEAPVPTEPPGPAANATCSNLTFYLDPSLGSSITCETIPASTQEMDTYPQYTKVTLQGYPLADKFFDPIIAIYPVSDYIALLPDHIPSRVAEMQNLIAGGAPSGDGYPFLPVFNAAQVFHARGGLLPFINGSGIRFLTEYAQYFAPVNNMDLFYTYQGLTADGFYWISVILPINHVILPEDAINPPGGVSWDAFAANYDTYIADMIAQLEAQPANSYTPSMDALDVLVNSIQVTP